MWNPYSLNPNKWDLSRYNPRSQNPDRGHHNPWGLSEELPYEPIYSKEDLCTMIYQKRGEMFHIKDFEEVLKKALQSKDLVQVGPDQYKSGKGCVDHAEASYNLEKDRLRPDGWGLGQREGQKQLAPSDRDDDSEQGRDRRRRKQKQIDYGDRY